MTAYRKRQQTRLIILHHSHTEETRGGIMSYLEANGRAKGLLDIGYHVVIGLDGAINSARPWDTVGSHAPGFNEESIGVCLEGSVSVSEEQVSALQFLLSIISHTYGPLKLMGHSELGRRRHVGCACPNLHMNRLRARLEGDPSWHHLPGDPMPSDQKLSPQQTIVLNLLQAGRTITNKLAASCYGVGDLPKRVSELRAMGYEIDREWDKEDFRGEEVRFLKYRLPKVADPS